MGTFSDNEFSVYSKSFEYFNPGVGTKGDIATGGDGKVARYRIGDRRTVVHCGTGRSGDTDGIINHDHDPCRSGGVAVTVGHFVNNGIRAGLCGIYIIGYLNSTAQIAILCIGCCRSRVDVGMVYAEGVRFRPDNGYDRCVAVIAGRKKVTRD